MRSEIFILLHCNTFTWQAAYFEDESAGLDGDGEEGKGGHADGADHDSDENKVCTSSIAPNIDFS